MPEKSGQQALEGRSAKACEDTAQLGKEPCPEMRERHPSSCESSPKSKAELKVKWEGRSHEGTN